VTEDEKSRQARKALDFAQRYGSTEPHKVVDALSYLEQERRALADMQLLHEKLLEQGYVNVIHDVYELKDPKPGGLNCYDCDKACGSYMVRDPVWRKAFPEYGALKTALRMRYPKSGPERVKGIIGLCFTCLELRLGRALEKEDFDFSLPINDGIKLGIQMERKP
jgi:hypothetical protein